MPMIKRKPCPLAHEQLTGLPSLSQLWSHSSYLFDGGSAVKLQLKWICHHKQVVHSVSFLGKNEKCKIVKGGGKIHRVL
jgi:hypothetical protein